MEENVENIVLLCLDGEYSRLVSQELAEKLEMFFADLKGYIEYDLIDTRQVLETCGVEYLRQREEKAAQTFARFQNSVLTVDFDLFKQNRSAFDERNLIIYIRLPQKEIDGKEVINKLSFDLRDEFAKNNAKIVVEIKSKNINKTVKAIIKKMQEAL